MKESSQYCHTPIIIMANSNKSSRTIYLQEAESGDTPQERLKELAQIKIELSRVVAKNPNAAPELLQKLGDYLLACWKHMEFSVMN